MNNIEENRSLLFDGYWYQELPYIEEFEQVKQNVEEVLENIKNKKYSGLELDSDLFINEFRLPEDDCPTYIFKGGVESISFFDFKKNGSYREMQIINLKYYMLFVYNTLNIYESLFYKLYTQEQYVDLVESSNSYVLFDEHFFVDRDYEGNEIDVAIGKFAVKNNKTTGQLAYERNSVKYLEKQSTYLYAVKVDVESFFPNIYTHYLEKCGENSLFIDDFADCKKYFSFLDVYNMKCNNNQTKGIAAGIFSSTISAELLMLCIDTEIKKLLDGKDIAYIRYVDDMTFFSNSIDEINQILPEVQRILNKYRLRINSNKTEKNTCIESKSYVDIESIKKIFDFKEKKYLDKDTFIFIKKYIANKYEKEERSELRAFLTLLKNSIAEDKIVIIDGEETLKNGAVYLCNLMVQLALLNPLFASRCYRVIDVVINKYNDPDSIMANLQSKNEYIDRMFNNTLVQMWHYYLIGKYDEDTNRRTSMLSTEEINALALCFLIKKGEGRNRDIFKYIMHRYAMENGDDMSALSISPESKKSIMKSKWWLPLFVIYLKDGKNYNGFYMSGSFEDIYKDLAKKSREE